MSGNFEVTASFRCLGLGNAKGRKEDEKKGVCDGDVDETATINKKYRCFAMLRMDGRIFFQPPTVYWTCSAHVNNAAAPPVGRAPLFLQTLARSIVKLLPRTVSRP